MESPMSNVMLVGGEHPEGCHFLTLWRHHLLFSGGISSVHTDAFSINTTIKDMFHTWIRPGV